MSHQQSNRLREMKLTESRQKNFREIQRWEQTSSRLNGVIVNNAVYSIIWVKGVLFCLDVRPNTYFNFNWLNKLTIRYCFWPRQHYFLSIPSNSSHLKIYFTLSTTVSVWKPQTARVLNPGMFSPACFDISINTLKVGESRLPETCPSDQLRSVWHKWPLRLLSVQKCCNIKTFISSFCRCYTSLWLLLPGAFFCMIQSMVLIHKISFTTVFATHLLVQICVYNELLLLLFAEKWDLCMYLVDWFFG